MTPAWPRAALGFAALLLLHDPIITLSGSAMLSHALLALGIAWFCASLGLRALRTLRFPQVGGLPTFGSVFALAVLGTLYSLMDSGSFNVRAQFLATFVLMPLMWMAFWELSAQPASRRAVHQLLLFYMATELAIMLLQVAYFIVGIGLPPNEFYDSMVPGSQFNGNNLAAIVVVLSIFYNATSQMTPRREWLLFNLITMAILLITFSRLAVLLYIFDRVRSLSVKQMGNALAVGVVLVAVGLIVSNIEYTGNETFDASLYKAKSLAKILEVGFDADSSTSGRSESYFNFIEQLGRLGIGSVAILDYSTYTSGAVFADEALYVNPHSMVIEFGYWMGWPGLLALGGFMLMVYMRSSQGTLLQRGYVLLAVLFASSIPSSAIPLPPFWVGLLLVAMLGAYGQPIRLRQRLPIVVVQPSNPTESLLQIR